MHPSELSAVATIARLLHPSSDLRVSDLTVLVWARQGRSISGLIMFSGPPEVDDTHRAHVKCIELLWVASYLRSQPVEQALLDAAAGW